MEKDPLSNPKAYPNKRPLPNPEAHPNPHRLPSDRPPMISHPTRERLATMPCREHPETPLCNLSKEPPASYCKVPHQPREPSQVNTPHTSRLPLPPTYPVTREMQEDHLRMGMVEKDHPMAAGPQGEDPQQEDPHTVGDHREEEGLLTEEPQGGYPTMAATHQDHLKELLQEGEEAMVDPQEDGGQSSMPFPQIRVETTTTTSMRGEMDKEMGMVTNCDNRDILNIESKLDLQKPEPFMGHDPKKWKTYVTECVMTFSAKPLTYVQPYLRVAFAASYLKEVALNHYTTHLTYNPNHHMFTDWEAFLYEFSTEFGIPNTQAEAENTLTRLTMKDWERFSMFIICFEQEAFETSWNERSLCFHLKRSLPKWILDLVAITPAQENYEPFKDLVSQIDHRYWEEHLDNPEAYRPPWQNNQNNTSTNVAKPGNAGTEMRDSMQLKSILTPPTTHKNLCREDHCNHDHSNVTEEQPQAGFEDEENLQANNQNGGRPWVAVPEETKAARRREGSCLLCRKMGHFIQDCPTQNAMGQAVYIIDGDTFEFQYEENNPAI
ncbi:hypothetical protein DXG01_003647 [Tephrocybe rancida]|nr:hypothetical protein DXG01_003647 [Tephrocybe rancida]